MKLLLSVINSPTDNNITGQTFAVDATGASIGRGAANGWVLPDSARIVSTQHATIGLQQGQYVITDRSTNGTFINNSPTPIGPGKSAPLHHDDIIRIGKYELKASLTAAAPRQKPVPDSFLDQLSSPLASAPAGEAAAASVLDDFDKWLEPQASASASAREWGTSNVEYTDVPALEEEIDPLAAFEKAREPDQGLQLDGPLTDDDSNWWKDSQPDNVPAINQAFEPFRDSQPSIQITQPQPDPLPAFGAGVAPVDDAADLDALLGLSSTPPAMEEPPQRPRPGATQAVDAVAPVAPVRPEPVRTPAPAASVAPTSAAAGASAQQLVEMLGLGQLTQEQLDALIPEVASIVKETVARLLEALRARTSIKNEMRLDRTMIQPMENNPLKFAITEKDALRYLFSADSDAYLAGSRAVREAFDDINDHQMALLAGMRAAYEDMLAHFAPAALERSFGDTQSKWLLGNKKSQLWEAYEQYFVKLQQDPEASFNRLFGHTFSGTYGEQIDEIKARRRKKS